MPGVAVVETAPGSTLLMGFGSQQEHSCYADGSVRVTPHDAPYLFKENGDSEWASAPAELLSVLVALQLFGYLEPKSGRTCIRLLGAERD